MVEFGKRLHDACDVHGLAWAGHCISYDDLKLLIESTKRSVIAAAADDDDSEDVSSQHDFRYALDREIEKAVLFVLQEQGSIAAELERLAERRAMFIQTASQQLNIIEGKQQNSLASPSSSITVKEITTPPRRSRSSSSNKTMTSLDELQQIHQEYVTIARLDIIQLIKFIDLNVTCVRKILKKYDKKTKTKLSHSYLSAYSNQYIDSHLDQLYHDGGLSSLVVSLRRAFDELHQVEMKLALNNKQTLQRGGHYQNNNHRRMNSLPATALSRDMTVHERLPSSTHVANREQITHDKEPILQMIRISRERLKQNTKYVDFIAAQALLFEESDEDDSMNDSITADAMVGPSRAQRISSVLNLSSTFLYMANYYIVAPTCGEYAARVGSSEAMAGIVIGMTPNAALIATVLYGWWSNYSYKSALIFAAWCSVLGNITYALALYYNSISLVLIGRFLNGFGSARSINRRFIADTFSKSERTAASAAFVTAAALGMSTGPALASLLSAMTFPPESTLWTKETAPGWIMLCLWLAFLLVFSLFFEEPDRTHLFGSRASATLELTSTNEEKTHLLADDAPSSEHAPEKKVEKVQTVVVIMTLWIYFVLKLVLESLLSSCATVTRFYFGWNSSNSGAFLAFLGLLMFPANMVVARLSYYYEDKELIRSFMVTILCGCIGIIAYLPNHYSVVQYTVFGIIIFISTNALEGPNMSLLSKTIPKSWARGTFNSGFLATEAGTLARSMGDVLISLAAVKGVAGMLNVIFFQMSCLALIGVLLVHRHYDRLVEDDEDDDKSN